MKKFVLAAAPLALLGACSGGSSDGIEPGEWTITMEIIDIEAPDAPPAALEAMQQQQAQTNSQCITPEQAANPDGGLFAPQSTDDCESMDFSMSGGSMDLNASCAVPGAGQMTMTMDGQYDRESMNGDIEMVMSETPMGTITMRGRLTGEHVGECNS